MQVDGDVVTMLERARDGVSAMARTTALTCAAFVRWVAAGKMQLAGAVPPEKLATDDAAYQFILDTLRGTVGLGGGTVNDSADVAKSD